MSRMASPFRQSDVQRALRACRAEGVKAVVEITRNGNIQIIPIEEGLTLPGSEASLDRELREHARTHGHG